MMLGIIVMLLSVITIAIIINYFENKLNKESSKISIKESMDLAQIPVVTFQEGDLSLNFLLDSGSSESHISKKVADTLIGVPIDADYTYTTSIGAGSISKMIESVLKYKDEEFKINLFINKDLDNSFDTIKKNCGVQLHGILGSNFLKKYKYILDFSKLVAYHK